MYKKRERGRENSNRNFCLGKQVFICFMAKWKLCNVSVCVYAYIYVIQFPFCFIK